MRFHNPFSSPKPTMPTHLVTEHQRELARLQAESHRNSIFDARDHITSFIETHYAEHLWPSIRIQCSLTLPQLRDIGRLNRNDGFRACLPLIRVPAIHEEVAEALWKFMAAERMKSEVDDDAIQEEWEQRFCGNAIRGPDDMAQKQREKDWYWARRWSQARTRSRACSLETLAEENVTHIEAMRCVFCCSGKLECDCRVPQEIMKEYGTLVGRKGADSGETTPEKGASKRESTATASSTATLVGTVSPTSVRSTSSTRSLFSPKIRRRLSFIPMLGRLDSLSKTPCPRPPEQEEQFSAHPFMLPEELCAIIRPVVPRGYSKTLGDLLGVDRGARPAVTNELAPAARSKERAD